MTDQAWPELPFAAWKDTCDTLHLYLQVAGKIRMALVPPEPEYAAVTLYVTARGLTTGPMPAGDRIAQIEFDFIAHRCEIDTSAGPSRSIDLASHSVSSFYAAMMAAVHDVGVAVEIQTMPQEVPDPIPFEQDTSHASYDREWVNRFYRVLALVDAAFRKHRAPYRGRHTPVHLFWGSFDLSYSRYSGRPADPPPNANKMMRNSMDAQEVCAGFWPGMASFPYAAFYCYGYPKPVGIEQAKIRPPEASWNTKVGEFAVLYDDVRKTSSPSQTILDFLSSTYEAVADLGAWDRPALERR
ncbi:MAG TPA: DUF5996 family protein [Candidatus Eremiobacteraceae bacterium]|nr:DUF5996 family protein [Candidatus Eremiobacteraceae bacterium]